MLTSARQVPDALGVGKVLVNLAHELILVVEQERLLVVEKRHMQALEFTDGLRQATYAQMGEHLAIHELAIHIHLGTVGGHEVHLVSHGREELAQPVEAAPRGCGEVHALLAQGENEVVGLGRNLAMLVKQGTVHVGGDEADQHELLSALACIREGRDIENALRANPERGDDRKREEDHAHDGIERGLDAGSARSPHEGIVLAGHVFRRAIAHEPAERERELCDHRASRTSTKPPCPTFRTASNISCGLSPTTQTLWES